jgi:hypothetical protein
MERCVRKKGHKGPHDWEIGNFLSALQNLPTFQMMISGLTHEVVCVEDVATEIQQFMGTWQK